MARAGQQRRMALARGALALLLALGWLVALAPAPAGAGAIPSVTVAADDDDGTCNAHCSLREALNVAAASPGHDTITFALPGAGPWTLYLQSTPTITQDLTITGPGRERLTIDGGYDGFGGNRLFTIGAGAVTIEHLTLANGYAGASWGGCLYINGGSLALRDARVLACRAPASGGGALHVSGGTALLERVELRGNVAGSEPAYGGGGGAIHANQYWGNTTLTIRDSVIAGNAAGGNSDGGGLKTHRLQDRGNNGFPFTLGVFIERSTIGGVAGDANVGSIGGGLYNDGGGLSLTNSVVSGNTARWDGGGLYNRSGSLTVTGSTLSGNTAIHDGAGIYSSVGTLTLTNSTLSGNAAGSDGGGLANAGGTVRLRFVTIVSNAVGTAQPSGTGGGIAHFSGTISLHGSILLGNRQGEATPNDCYYNFAATHTLWGGAATGCIGGGNSITYCGALADLLDPVLRDNGGPTLTHALTPSSPARDRVPIDNCLVGTDQRGSGFPRPETPGTRCDIGAVEGTAPAPNPSPSPGAQVALTVTTAGAGAIGRSPAGSGGGPFGYAPGDTVSLTPQPDPGQTFVGWAVDGVHKGWAPSIALTMDAAHTVKATFAPTRTFPDVSPSRADYAAIVALATRGAIFGYGTGNFGPDDGVQRAQMAALISRGTGTGPDTPPTMLTPPACLVAGTWDCEDWGNSFTDRSGDPNLWRNAGTLQHYGVALGYTQGDCAAKGRAFPCYGPSDPVTYAQTITFITRMMKTKGYWLAQPAAPLPYANVPGPHAEDVRTFHYYTGGIPAPPTDWNANTTRGWFAQALWTALNSYWGTDGNLLDGRPGGGMVP